MFNFKPALTVAIASTVLGTALHAHADCGASHASRKNIVETAAAAGQFNTLIAAAKAADLVDTLTSPGPFTVFAPTDEAFGKLPAGTIETLLANPDRLAAILKLHVVPGRVPAKKVLASKSLTTALGQSVMIQASHGAKIGDANIVKTDIETSNGIIHVIDTVLLPTNDIIETARGAGSFKTLLAAVEAAGLTEALRGDGPFTVFAPTDAAFAKLPAGTVEGLLNDIPKLKSILTYHVVAGRFEAKDVVNLTEATTLQGKKVRISSSRGVKINDSNVVQPDVSAENGVIHVIDTVLLPPTKVSQSDAVRGWITAAIDRGVPMFNNGNHAACKEIYQTVAMGLVENYGDALDAHQMGTLRKALMTVERSHDMTDNAWTLRRALDNVYASVGG